MLKHISRKSEVVATWLHLQQLLLQPGFIQALFCYHFILISVPGLTDQDV